MNRILCSCFVAALGVFIGAPAMAQTPAAESAAGGGAEAHQNMGLSRGVWLRAGLGFNSSTLQLSPPGGAPPIRVTADGASALGVGLGYAPTSWIAVGVIGSLREARMNIESGGTSTTLGLTYLAPMLGARLYPFKSLGLNFGLGGGWSWALVHASRIPKVFTGPAWMLAIGLDDSILRRRAWTGRSLPPGKLGASLQFDHSPALQGSNWTGSAWGLSVLIDISM